MAALFSSTFATNAQSPLYVIYERRYALSSLAVTSLSATYAVGVVVALLVVGGLSDVIGRRALLITSAALLLSSTVLLLSSSGAAWLFVGRAAIGVATGILLSAGTAALVELEPDQRRRRAAVRTTFALLAGTALGPLASGVFAQYLPGPTRTTYLIEVVVQATTFIGVLGVGETATTLDRTGAVWRARLGVPREIRGPFLLAGGIVAAGWMMGGAFAALSGSIDREVLHVTSHAVAGLVLFSFATVAGLSQVVARSLAPRPTVVAGLCSTAVGAGLVAGAMAANSALLFIVATVVSGIGNGLSFVGSLALVNEIAPPTRRAEVTAVYNLIMYATLILPVMGMGLLADALGLERATAVFAVVLAGGCAGILVAVTRFSRELTETRA